MDGFLGEGLEPFGAVIVCEWFAEFVLVDVWPRAMLL
jgi:hypothetical protein